MFWSILAGTLPLLVLGFAASAVGNRLVFVAWGVACAAVYAGVVRYGLRAGWRRRALAVAALAVLAAAAASFVLLVARHREALVLGLHALMP